MSVKEMEEGTRVEGGGDVPATKEGVSVPLSPPVPSPTIANNEAAATKESSVNGDSNGENGGKSDQIEGEQPKDEDEKKEAKGDGDVSMEEAPSASSEKHELAEPHTEQPAKKFKSDDDKTNGDDEDEEKKDEVEAADKTNDAADETKDDESVSKDAVEESKEESAVQPEKSEESSTKDGVEEEPKTDGGEETNITEASTPKEVKEEEGKSSTGEVKSEDTTSLDPPEGAEPGLPKHQQKFIVNTIRSVKRLKDAMPFLKPVDPVKLNVPTYYEVIKNPMDLGAMEKKAQKGEYLKMSEFSADMDLIVANCESFNGKDTPISAMARNIKSSFDRYMSNAPPYNLPPDQQGKKRRSLPPANTTPKSQRVAAAAATAANAAAQSSDSTKPESKPFALQPSGIPTIRRDSAADGRPKREIHPPKPKDLMYGDMKPRKKKFAAELKFCGQVLKELMSKKHEAYSFPFLQPVDPVALNCPNYFKVIKEPMDLSTVQYKYNNNQYETADEFAADIKLMFRNCYKFNPEGSPVNVMGHRLEQVFDTKWLDKPAPAPTPPPPDSSDEGSDFEFTEELSNPAIKFLEEQLERMKEELSKLKREAVREARKNGRRRKGKGSKTTTDRRRSGSRRESASQPVMTFEMKKELSEKIGNLPEKKLRHVVTIIQESMPHLKNSDQDEIELDMDQLDPETLLKLYNYVVRKDDQKRATKSATPTNSSNNNVKTKKKSKPLTEAEQSRQIMQIQEKIQQFDQAGKTNVAASSSTPTSQSHNINGRSDNESSSDENNESSDDSSSEEE